MRSLKCFPHFSSILCVIVCCSAAQPLLAQTVTNPNVSTTISADGKRVAFDATGTTGTPAPLKIKPLKSATRDRAKLAAYNNAAWDALLHQGTCKDPQSSACANDALLLAGSTCSSSALIFQRGTATWQKVGVVLVIASAGFTGIGSAATIAGSTTVPKIFSTLGGTTGLGAVTATANSNISYDQNGVAAVNTVQDDIQKLPAPIAGESSTNQLILSQAEGYANKCVAANTASSGASATSKPSTAPAGSGSGSGSSSTGSGS